MKISEAIYEECQCCGRRKATIKEEQIGCDNCGKLIDDDEASLQATIFRHEGEGESLDCCSWKCVVEKLSTIKTDYFASLPYLHFDEARVGHRAQDFFELLKPTAQAERKISYGAEGE